MKTLALGEKLAKMLLGAISENIVDSSPGESHTKLYNLAKKPKKLPDKDFRERL